MTANVLYHGNQESMKEILESLYRSISSSLDMRSNVKSMAASASNVTTLRSIGKMDFAVLSLQEVNLIKSDLETMIIFLSKMIEGKAVIQLPLRDSSLAIFLNIIDQCYAREVANDNDLSYNSVTYNGAGVVSYRNVNYSIKKG